MRRRRHNRHRSSTSRCGPRSSVSQPFAWSISSCAAATLRSASTSSATLPLRVRRTSVSRSNQQLALAKTGFGIRHILRYVLGGDRPADRPSAGAGDRPVRARCRTDGRLRSPRAASGSLSRCFRQRLRCSARGPDSARGQVCRKAPHGPAAPSRCWCRAGRTRTDRHRPSSGLTRQSVSATTCAGGSGITGAAGASTSCNIKLWATCLLDTLSHAARPRQIGRINNSRMIALPLCYGTTSHHIRIESTGAYWPVSPQI